MDALARRLEELVRVLEEAAKDTPDVIVRPSIDKVHEARRELAAAALEGSMNRTTEVDAAAIQELNSLEAELTGLVAQLEKQVDSDPWNQPQVLRELRKMEVSLVEQAQRLRARQRSIFPGKAAEEELPWWNEASKRNAMLEELYTLQELSRTPQQHVPVWGIVHAAGVQNVLALVNENSAHWEKTLAPKGQAAYMLHQLNVMRP
mmetsp:Transcript_0/g.1  ORF Transcript_0/g.1 Transcript_0/m.1 type:complete len:205 (-) Transcript_0:117-731(-)